jgi:lipoprotein-anchoring transpeptidase ErfK/SrfK
MRRLSLLSCLLAATALTACGDPKPISNSEGTAPAAISPAAVPMASGLSRQAIETAVWSAPVTDSPTADAAPAPAPGAPPVPPMPKAEIIRAQILLDRARFSPGIIDGFGGENTRQAVAAYEEANDLPVDGELDAQVFARLTEASGAVLIDHVITAEDVAGPFGGPVPTSLEAMAELETLAYATPLEALAEKFHVSEGLLTAFNPGVDFSRAGQTIVVPSVAAAPLPEVTRIVVDKSESSLRAFGADGALLAFYPATIGSTERPAPSGTVTVVAIAPEPNYTYDPSRVSYDRGDRRLVVPAGPNNPVGSVWIDLSRDTYGIHGTPDPSKIAKTQSNGCVRLTNWSAEQLAASVKPGVEVVFT